MFELSILFLAGVAVGATLSKIIWPLSLPSQSAIDVKFSDLERDVRLINSDLVRQTTKLVKLEGIVANLVREARSRPEPQPLRAP